MENKKYLKTNCVDVFITNLRGVFFNKFVVYLIGMVRRLDKNNSRKI